MDYQHATPTSNESHIHIKTLSVHHLVVIVPLNYMYVLVLVLMK